MLRYFFAVVVVILDAVINCEGGKWLPRPSEEDINFWDKIEWRKKFGKNIFKN